MPKIKLVKLEKILEERDTGDIASLWSVWSVDNEIVLAVTIPKENRSIFMPKTIKLSMENKRDMVAWNNDQIFLHEEINKIVSEFPSIGY